MTVIQHCCSLKDMETHIRLGVYDEAGRYLGPADVVIRFWLIQRAA